MVFSPKVPILWWRLFQTYDRYSFYHYSNISSLFNRSVDLPVLGTLKSKKKNSENARHIKTLVRPVSHVLMGGLEENTEENTCRAKNCEKHQPGLCTKYFIEEGLGSSLLALLFFVAQTTSNHCVWKDGLQTTYLWQYSQWASSDNLGCSHLSTVYHHTAPWDSHQPLLSTGRERGEFGWQHTSCHFVDLQELSDGQKWLSSEISTGAKTFILF